MSQHFQGELPDQGEAWSHRTSVTVGEFPTTVIIKMNEISQKKFVWAHLRTCHVASHAICHARLRVHQQLEESILGVLSGRPNTGLLILIDDANQPNTL